MALRFPQRRGQNPNTAHEALPHLLPLPPWSVSFLFSPAHFIPATWGFLEDAQHTTIPSQGIHALRSSCQASCFGRSMLSGLCVNVVLSKAFLGTLKGLVSILCPPFPTHSAFYFPQYLFHIKQEMIICLFIVSSLVCKLRKDKAWSVSFIVISVAWRMVPGI